MSDLLQELGPLALASRLKRLVDQLMQDGIRVYRETGLAFEPRWFPVYFYLTRIGPSAMTEIARGLGVSHPSVNQIAKEMSRANLVATYKDARDKRRRVLALTHYGRSMLPELEAVWRDIRSSLSEVVESAGPDFLERVGQMESALAEKDFYTRFRDRHLPGRLERIEIRDIDSSTAEDFSRLNEAWISEHFTMEEADRRMLADPIGYVVEHGGFVLIARDVESHEVLGTCAVVKQGEVVAEIAKMTVSKTARGLGIGKLIGRAAIQRARAAGFSKIYLETNSSLAPAIRLYEELGFVAMPAPVQSDYARADVYMELGRR